MTKTLYDGLGRRATLTDPLGQETTFTYNRFNEVIEQQATAPAVSGLSPKYISWTKNTSIDELGRILEQRSMDGTVVTYRFDANGNLTKTTKFLAGSSELADYSFMNPAVLRLSTVAEANRRSHVEEYDNFDRQVRGYDLLVDGSVVVSGGGFSISGFGATRISRSSDGHDITLSLDGHGLQVGDRVYIGPSSLSGLEGVRYVIAVGADENSNTGTFTVRTQSVVPDIELEGIAVTVGMHVVSKEYDVHGRVTSVTDPRGVETSTTYDLLGLPKVVSTGETSNEWIQAVTPVSESFEYNPDGSIRQRTDALGREEITYVDVAGRTVTTVVPHPTQSGQWLSSRIGMDVLGRVESSRDRVGSYTQTEYDLNGRVVKSILPHPESVSAAGPTTYTFYDQSGRASMVMAPDTAISTSQTDALGRAVGSFALSPQGEAQGVSSISLSPDLEATNGRLLVELTTTSPLSGVEDAGWLQLASEDYRLLLNIDSRNGSTIYASVDTNEQVDVAALVALANSGGVQAHPVVVMTSSTNRYEANRLVESIDARGFSTKTAYNANGLPIETRGGATGDELLASRSYNSFGEVISSTSYANAADSQGSTTSYTYDRLGRQSFVTDPAIQVLTDAESLGSRTLSVIAPKRGFGYDASGHVVWQTDPRAEVWIGTDASKRVAAIADNRNTSTSVYDALGRKIEEHSADPDGAGSKYSPSVSSFVYDAVGNVILSVDPRGVRSLTNYDSLNRPVVSASSGVSATITSIAGNDVTFKSQDHGLQVGDHIAISSANGTTHRYVLTVATVSGRDQFIATKDSAISGVPTGAVTLYLRTSQTAYDNVGNIITTVDARGKTTTTTYDKLNRKASVQLPKVDTNDDGEPDTHPTTTFIAYDGAGRLLSMISPRGNASGESSEYAISYVYDSLGRKIEEQGPLEDVMGIDGSYSDQRSISTFDYDSTGNLIATTDPSGARSETSYDYAGRAIETRSGVFPILSYSLSSGSPSGTTLTINTDGGHKLESGMFVVLRGDTNNKLDGVFPIRVTTSSQFVVTLGGSFSAPLPDHLSGALAIVNTQYDRQGRATKATDSYGSTSETVYDALGRVIATIAPDAVTGQPRASGTNAPIGATVRTGYDLGGNVAWTLDAIGSASVAGSLDSLTKLPALVTTDITATGARTSLYRYDALNRQFEALSPAADHDDNSSTATVRSASRVTQFDPSGNVITSATQRTNSSGSLVDVTQYVFIDGRGRSAAAGSEETSVYISVDSNNRAIIDNDDLPLQLKANDQVLLHNTLRPSQGGPEAQLNGVFTVLEVVNGVTTLSMPSGRSVSSFTNGATSISFNVSSSSVDGNGNVVSTTDPRGQTTTLDYDALNRNTKITQPSVEYLTASRTTATGSPITTTSFDIEGNVLKTVSAIGNATSAATEWSTLIEYDRYGRKRFERSAIPNGTSTEDREVTEYRYDVAGRLVETIDPLENSTTSSYDPIGRVFETTSPDPDGSGSTYTASVTRQGVDPNGNVIWSTSALGIDHSENQNLAVPTAYTTLNKYDRMNRLIESTSPDPDGGSSSLAASTSKFGYDLNGNKIWSMSPIGVAELNAPGNSISLNDRITQRRHTTVLQYDALNRLVKQTDSDPDSNNSTNGTGQKPPTTEFAYLVSGELLSRTDASGNETRYQYDLFGRKIKETVDIKVSGVTTAVNRTWGYDATGNLLETTDRNGRTITYTYNSLNQQTSETWTGSGANGYVATFQYDLNGRLIRSSDPNSYYLYEYDRLGQVLTKASYDPATNTPSSAANPISVVTHGYTEMGQTEFTNVWHKQGSALVYDFGERFEYDNLGRVIAITQAGGAVSSKRVEYGYDADGNTTSIQRFNNAVGTGTPTVDTTQLFDRMGRLRKILHETPDHDVNFTGASNADLSYDLNSRLLTSVSTLGDNDTYIYDANGQINTVDHANSGSVQQPDESYGYDDTGNRTNNSGTANTSELNNRLVNDGTYTYSYDNEGNLTGKVGNSKNYVYTYDFHNRLTKVQDGSTIVSLYTYDVDGNRIAKQVGSSSSDKETYILDGSLLMAAIDNTGKVTKAYFYGKDVDEVLAEEEILFLSAPVVPDIFSDAISDFSNGQGGTNIPGGKYRVSYAGGAMQYAPARDFSIDDSVVASDRFLVAYNDHNNTVDAPGDSAFTHSDASVVIDHYLSYGDSAEITHSSGTIGVYLYDINFPDNSASAEFGSPAFRLAQSTAVWSLPDHLGTVRQTVDADGEAVDTLTLNSFGKLVSHSATSLALPRFVYTGQEHDPETGYTFMNARYYDPNTARFISQDPIGFEAGDSNLYRYTGNGASYRTDPNGTDWLFDDVLGIDDDGGILGSIRHLGRWLGDTLTDFGNSLYETLGFSFTIPLGPFSFGWGPNTFTLGFGGASLRLVQDAYGHVDADFGASLSVGPLSVGFMGGDFNFGVGVTYGGFGFNLGADTNGGVSFSAGPSYVGKHGTANAGVSLGFGNGKPSFGVYGSYSPGGSTFVPGTNGNPSIWRANDASWSLGGSLSFQGGHASFDGSAGYVEKSYLDRAAQWAVDGIGTLVQDAWERTHHSADVSQRYERMQSIWERGRTDVSATDGFVSLVSIQNQSASGSDAALLAHLENRYADREFKILADGSAIARDAQGRFWRYDQAGNEISYTSPRRYSDLQLNDDGSIDRVTRYYDSSAVDREQVLPSEKELKRLQWELQHLKNNGPFSAAIEQQLEDQARIQSFHATTAMIAAGLEFALGLLPGSTATEVVGLAESFFGNPDKPSIVRSALFVPGQDDPEFLQVGLLNPIGQLSKLAKAGKAVSEAARIIAKNKKIGGDFEKASIEAFKALQEVRDLRPKVRFFGPWGKQGLVGTMRNGVKGRTFPDLYIDGLHLVEAKHVTSAPLSLSLPQLQKQIDIVSRSPGMVYNLILSPQTRLTKELHNSLVRMPIPAKMRVFNPSTGAFTNYVQP